MAQSIVEESMETATVDNDVQVWLTTRATDKQFKDKLTKEANKV